MAHPVSTRLTLAEGRRFGLTVGLAFLALAALVAWRGHAIAAAALAIPAVLLCAAGAVIPQSLGPVQRAWMTFALLLSKVTTPIFLGVVYFLVITPTGFLRRSLGRTPMRPRADGTFWVSRGRENRGDLTRQF